MLFPILLEPLHGITYGAVQCAMVEVSQVIGMVNWIISYASVLSVLVILSVHMEFVAQTMPTGREATGQGLVYLFKDGGSVLGVLVGGLADSRSSDLMFAISAIVVGTGSAILLSSLLAQKYSRTYVQLQAVS